MKNGYALINGAQLYYETDGHGYPLFLVHGMGLDHRMWDGQFATFANNYEVIRYDLRGFGRSSLPTAESYAHHTDLKSLMEYLGHSKAHLTGLSMGGRVVMDFAIAFPEMVASLIMVDSTIHGYKNKNDLTGSITTAAAAGGAKAANEAWLNHDLFIPARRNAAVAGQLAQMVNDYSGWHWVNKNPWTPIDPPAITKLNKITAPSLIIVGEKDVPDFRDMADLLHEQIPGSRIEIIKDVGHMSNMEDTATFNKLVLDFLSPAV